jgi:membrane protein
LIWLYLNWLVLLIGAQIAFYYQNPAFLRIGRQESHLSNSTRERLVLNIMYLVGKAFRVPGTRVNASDVSSSLGIPTIAMMPIAAKLENAGLLVLTENEQWVPGREMSRITVSEILAVVRSDNDTGSSREPSWTDSIDQLGERIDNAVDTSVENETLADMLGPE